MAPPANDTVLAWYRTTESWSPAQHPLVRTRLPCSLLVHSLFLSFLSFPTSCQLASFLKPGKLCWCCCVKSYHKVRRVLTGVQGKVMYTSPTPGQRNALCQRQRCHSLCYHSMNKENDFKSNILWWKNLRSVALNLVNHIWIYPLSWIITLTLTLRV